MGLNEVAAVCEEKRLRPTGGLETGFGLMQTILLTTNYK
jgi:hypothetical protein